MTIESRRQSRDIDRGERRSTEGASSSSREGSSGCERRIAFTGVRSKRAWRSRTVDACGFVRVGTPGSDRGIRGTAWELARSRRSIDGGPIDPAPEISESPPKRIGCRETRDPSVERWREIAIDEIGNPRDAGARRRGVEQQKSVWTHPASRASEHRKVLRRPAT